MTGHPAASTCWPSRCSASWSGCWSWSPWSASSTVPGRPNATFVGYLITTIAFAPAAFVLARMEPTRWGNLILGVACLVLPVLVLRLQQIASVTGG